MEFIARLGMGLVGLFIEVAFPAWAQDKLARRLGRGEAWNQDAEVARANARLRELPNDPMAHSSTAPSATMEELDS